MKPLFIIAGILIILGVVLFVSVLASNGWDITALNTAKFQSNTYPIKEDFQHITVSTNTADVLFALSDNEMCQVVCYEQENMAHRVSVKDGMLEISAQDTRKWYEHISFFSFGAPKITVYLPQAEYAELSIKTDTGDVNIPKDFLLESINITVSTGDVKCFASAAGQIKVKTSTGDIFAQGISAGALDLTVSTGKVQGESITCQGDVSIRVSTGKTILKDVQCQGLDSTGSTGDIVLQAVVAAERFSIARSTGDVKLDGCDANDIRIRTDTGNVYGSLLSDKVFIAKTDTGRVDVPKTITGGHCEIETNTGNIQITTP